MILMKIMDRHQPSSLVIMSAMECMYNFEGAEDLEFLLHCYRGLYPRWANGYDMKSFLTILFELKTGRMLLRDVPLHLRTYDLCYASVENDRDCINLQYVPVHLRTKPLCERAAMATRPDFKSRPRLIRSIPYDVLAQDDAEMCYKIVRSDPASLALIPDILKTYRVCLAAVSSSHDRHRTRVLADVPARHLTFEMCQTAVTHNPLDLRHVPLDILTEEFVERVMMDNGSCLAFVPLHLRSVNVCAIAVNEYPPALKFVPAHLQSAMITDQQNLTTEL